MIHVTHPLSFADIINFLPKVNKFGYIKNFRYRLLFVFKDFFNKYGYNFDDASKITLFRAS